jgi:hypothetical protein
MVRAPRTTFPHRSDGSPDARFPASFFKDLLVVRKNIAGLMREETFDKSCQAERSSQVVMFPIVIGYYGSILGGPGREPNCAA